MLGVLLCFVVGCGLAQATCPDGATEIGGRCFKKVNGYRGDYTANLCPGGFLPPAGGDYGAVESMQDDFWLHTAPGSSRCSYWRRGYERSSRCTYDKYVVCEYDNDVVGTAPTSSPTILGCCAGGQIDAAHKCFSRSDEDDSYSSAEDYCAVNGGVLPSSTNLAGYDDRDLPSRFWLDSSSSSGCSKFYRDSVTSADCSDRVDIVCEHERGTCPPTPNPTTRPTAVPTTATPTANPTPAPTAMPTYSWAYPKHIADTAARKLIKDKEEICQFADETSSRPDFCWGSSPEVIVGQTPAACDEGYVYEGLMCYEEAKEGYTCQGVALDCGHDCPPEYTDLGWTCSLTDLSQLVLLGGDLENPCPDASYPAEKNGYCYTHADTYISASCPSGYTKLSSGLCRHSSASSDTTSASCPSGYQSLHGGCYKNGVTSLTRLCDWCTYKCCGTCDTGYTYAAGLCYAQSTTSRNCPSGYQQSGLTCTAIYTSSRVCGNGYTKVEVAGVYYCSANRIDITCPSTHTYSTTAGITMPGCNHNPPSTMVDGVMTVWNAVMPIADKPKYWRPFPVTAHCGGSSTSMLGLCYECPADKVMLGFTCWDACPAESPIRCQLGCAKDVASCEEVVNDQLKTSMLTAFSMLPYGGDIANIISGALGEQPASVMDGAEAFGSDLVGVDLAQLECLFKQSILEPLGKVNNAGVSSAQYLVYTEGNRTRGMYQHFSNKVDAFEVLNQTSSKFKTIKAFNDEAFHCGFNSWCATATSDADCFIEVVLEVRELLGGKFLSELLGTLPFVGNLVAVIDLAHAFTYPVCNDESFNSWDEQIQQTTLNEFCYSDPSPTAGVEAFLL